VPERGQENERKDSASGSEEENGGVLEMKFQGFSIHAQPFITDATCRECRNGLKEVSNGFLSVAMFCPKCESVYILRLVKMPNDKVTTEFLAQAREEIGKRTALK
jgi:hypothetical protein